ncbi:MAG: twin-arginine translocase TatA/TatE family subunit [Proteobacteria bacterium]|nr:twin-arginine translocase TatA/TatE family subunit [Pseudomonadota bacterium]
MGTFSIWHWLIVLAVVLLLFGGRGKISGLMGDFGKGLKSFKKGMKDDDEEEIASEEDPKILKSESVAAPAPEKDRAAES